MLQFLKTNMTAWNYSAAVQAVICKCRKVQVFLHIHIHFICSGGGSGCDPQQLALPAHYLPPLLSPDGSGDDGDWCSLFMLRKREESKVERFFGSCRIIFDRCAITAFHTDWIQQLEPLYKDCAFFYSARLKSLIGDFWQHLGEHYEQEFFILCKQQRAVDSTL